MHGKFYIIYTAHIQNPPSLTAHLSVYADDTATMESSKNLKNLTTNLKKAYKTTQKWLEKWKIKINYTKTQLILIISQKREEPTQPLTIEKLAYRMENQGEYLGVTFERPHKYKT